MDFYDYLKQQSTDNGIECHAVGIVAFTELGKVLLLKKSNVVSSQCELPNALIDKGESIIDALSRVLDSASAIALDNISMYIDSVDYTVGNTSCRQFNFALFVRDDIVDSKSASEGFVWTSLGDALASESCVDSKSKKSLEIFNYNKQLKIMGTHRSALAYCFDEEI